MGSRPSYKYDNTHARGEGDASSGSSSHEITPFDSGARARARPFALAPCPLCVCSLRCLSKGTYPYRPSCITLVVVFRRFTILEIRKRELKFHHGGSVDADIPLTRRRRRRLPPPSRRRHLHSRIERAKNARKSIDPVVSYKEPNTRYIRANRIIRKLTR